MGAVNPRPAPAPVSRATARAAYRDEQLGIALALACAVNAAFVPAVAKVTTAYTDAATVAFLTTVIGAAVAVVVLAVRGMLSALWAPHQRVSLCLLGILGTGVSFYLFFSGAEKASAVETVLCLQIEPVYSLLLAWWFLGQRPTRQRAGSTVVILLGLGLALGVRDFPSSAGVAYLLATPLCWQLSHLIVLRKLAGAPLEALTAARYLWGALVLGLLWLATPARGGSVVELPPSAWIWLAIQGAVLSYGGTTLWYGAVRRIDLARATVLVVPTVPVLALIVSFLLLGEVPSFRELVGVSLTIVGVTTFAARPAQHRWPRKPDDVGA